MGAFRPVADHSSWAKRVRWSCGRPGYMPTFTDNLASWGKLRQQVLMEDYARAMTTAQILRPDLTFYAAGV